MAIQLTISSDLQALVEKRFATGAYENVEDMLRCALEAQEAAEVDWTDEERQGISNHIEEGFQQAERGQLYDEDQVIQHLAEFKQRWLNDRQVK